MTNQEQIKDLIARKEALKKFLDIDNTAAWIAEEEKKTEAPDFWNDPKEAQKVVKGINAKKTWVTSYKDVDQACGDLEVMGEFFESGDASEEELVAQIAVTQKKVEELEFKNMLRNESDRLDAVLSINAGAGGVEAQDWAEMLMRMYIRYAETHGYKVAISNSLDGEGAGIKSCTLQIEGDFAFGYLKSETGVHRLVRVSPFNAQGKRMTSFTSVSVTPLIDDTIEVVGYEPPELGYLPQRRCWRTERQQGGVRRAPALSVQGPLHWCRGGNPHREHRDARPAQEQGECHASAALAAL